MSILLIEKIRQKFPGRFDDLHLLSAELYKADRDIILFFSSKQVFSADDKGMLHGYITELFPSSYTVRLDFSKIYCDKEIAEKEITGILSADFPSINAAMTDITCTEEDGGFKIRIVCYIVIQSYIKSSRADALIAERLTEKYKQSFTVEVEYIENPLPKVKESPQVVVAAQPEERAEDRLIEVFEISPFIGKTEAQHARYIEDCNTSAAASVYLCGKISDFSERITKSERIIINFTLEDFTSRIPCVMFPTAATLNKARQLEDGTEILAGGAVEFDSYRNCYSFKVRSLSLCTLPAEFKPVQKQSLPVPDEYRVVFPQKVEVAAQVDFFGGGVKEISKYFFNRNFVVFDIETTGLNYDLDRITEIGAIKIEDGIITKSFSTLINPEVHIREETIKLNGIDDELVKDMPKIEEVMPDFYKFSYGAELVAHNIDFDYKFIKFNADKMGYYFYNKKFDTLTIARERVKGLSNYKLDTLCAHFNIDLTDHHRAWNDALATAKLYIELMNYKG